VFHSDVAKVDRVVAYVAMVVQRMLQVCIPNVSPIFSDICYKCIYLEVIYVADICCKYFIWMLRMFTMVFQVFFL
jgi:hypothetical protein